MKTALITGVCGQDGAYLSRLLLDKGYQVIGLSKPRTSMDNLYSLEVFGHPDFKIIDCDITDPEQISWALTEYRPDEIYNLAAQSHVGFSFKSPQQTCAVNYGGYLNILLNARRIVPKAKIYQAGTSEMFGYSAKNNKQSETTPFMPKSPYAIAKVAAHWAGVNARYEADQFVCNGILFNHESPLRHESFVTRKITKAISRIVNGEDHILRLGNIDSKRDWGHARDYVDGMWRMLQYEKPDDYVLATGETRTVREFVIKAFSFVGMKIEFEGAGASERGYVDQRLVLEIDPDFYRPNELDYLCGDFSKAYSVLDWKPSTDFNTLVKEMITGDLK